jgi:hypothetical protein
VLPWLVGSKQVIQGMGKNGAQRQLTLGQNPSKWKVGNVHQK